MGRIVLTQEEKDRVSMRHRPSRIVLRDKERAMVESAISLYFRKPLKSEVSEHMFTADIHFEMEYDRRRGISVQAIGRALKRMGFVRQRKTGGILFEVIRLERSNTNG